MSQHGTIHWSELVTGDVAAARKYFSTVAGWTINEMPMPKGPYNVCMVGDKPVAGIMDLKMNEDPNAPPQWMTYIAVDDVDKAEAQTKAAGGEIVRPPFDVEGVGRIMIVKDPSGAVVGLMTPAG